MALVSADMMRWAGTLFLIGFVYGVISFLLQVAFGLSAMTTTVKAATPEDLRSHAIFMYLAFIPVYTVMQLCTSGMQYSGLQQARGYKQEFSDSFRFNGMALQVLLFNLICALVIFGLQATLLASVAADPTIIFQGSSLAVIVLLSIVFSLIYWSFSLTPLIIIDQRMPMFPAMKLCAKTFGPHILMLWLVLFCAGFLAGLGIFACCVGILFTAPLAIVVNGVIYNDFFRPTPPTVTAESAEGYRPPWQG